MRRRSLVLVATLSLTACAVGDDGVDPRGGDGGDVLDAGTTPPLSDGAPPCEDGTTVECRTECGTLGTATCSGGRVRACAAPDEACDGVDQDCDGAIDESVPNRTCTVACGGGTSRCEGGRFTACEGGTPTDETCDGTDEDCDGAIDEGVTRACTSACGTGTETCSDGAFGGCDAPAPGTETCDGTDEDCDGTVDESLSRGCTTACGSGTETCSAGSWVGCTAPAPIAESCDLADQDCDGAVDEGFQAHVFDPVPMAELTAAQPPCDGPGARIDVCMSAARRWCHAHAWGCFAAGGAGHLQATATSARVVCFGNRGDERTVTYATVSSASGISVTDTNVTTRVAQSAVNRYCRSLGFGAGVGPTEHSAGMMTVTCLPSDVAVTVSIPTSDLGARGCSPTSDPNGLTCSSAADHACRDRGHASGYGPVEWNATDSAVVCFVAGA